MATKTYDGDIKKSTDWGGDSSTSGLPVSGKAVQKFVKDEIGSKIGAIYKPDGSNTLYTFSTPEDKAEYLNTYDESLILDSVKLDSDYEVLFDTEKKTYKVLNGTTGNVITTTFKIANKNTGNIADTKATVKYTFEVDGNKDYITRSVDLNSEGYTTITSDVIDDYLKEGKCTTITVYVEGTYTFASSQENVKYYMFGLTYTPSFNYYIPQPESESEVIKVNYSCTCSQKRTYHFYIDGEEVKSISSSDSIDMNKYVELPISELAVGYHTLQTFASIDISGDTFNSDKYYYTFAKSGECNPVFLMAIKLDNTAEIRTGEDNLVISSTQYEELSFNWSLYDYYERNIQVYFEYSGSVVSTDTVAYGDEPHEFSFRPMYGGSNELKIYAYASGTKTKIFEEVIDLDTKEMSGVSEASDPYIKLTASGKRNSDTNKDVWEYHDTLRNQYIIASFSGFSFDSQQGWNEEENSLRISNGAQLTFLVSGTTGVQEFNPLDANYINKEGVTLELEFETYDVEDDDAVILQVKSDLESAASITITGTKAEIATTNGISINTRFRDNDKLKIAFIANKVDETVTTQDGNLLYMMVNGILERAGKYGDDDSISSPGAKLIIGDANGKCKMKLYSIRYYQRALSIEDEFGNYVIDSNNSSILYDKNDILDDSKEVSYDKIINKIPVMIFTGDMNDLVTNGKADKDWRYFDVEYINLQEPERNFVSFNCRLKLQGTSSLNYPRKNFKLSTKDKYFNDETPKGGGVPYMYDDSDYILDTDRSSLGNYRLMSKKTGKLLDFTDTKANGHCITLDYNHRPLKKGRYRFREDAHKADKWTLKADFMESSGSHNVGAGRSWNKIFENTELTYPAGVLYTNETYRSAALNLTGLDKYGYKSYTRDGVEYKIPVNTTEYLNQKDYVCRTNVQKICKSENADDIRTAVDGFPMVCFYRTSHEENNLIFMGQYNFINDKSSFEVFGFEDIESPNDSESDVYIFDSEKVECWEGLKNTNPISLFETTDNWDDTDKGWANTFTSRYPDADDGEYDASKTSPLYKFCSWLTSTRHESDTVIDSSNTITINTYVDKNNGNKEYDSFAQFINLYQYGYTSATTESYEYTKGGTYADTAENRQKKFEVEKWEHFDVWKLAGYYIYLMRYGAVDQFVKNTMLFTDGNGLYDCRDDKEFRKWFYINYDNDCLFGLRNIGQLAFDWKLDRQTKDSASEIEVEGETEVSGNTYAMMGHDSTLWNNLERDEEFMRMVRDLDNAMHTAGLNYDDLIEEFDTNQTEKWCERIYNYNEIYKYIDSAKAIGDMSGSTAVNDLWMLQGTRRAHRKWWIANRFNLYDAKWLSGNYKSFYLELKTDCEAGTTIYAKAGEDYYFAWGQNKRNYEVNIEKKKGDDILFTFADKQASGDPVLIYAFNKMSEIDLSEIASQVKSGSFIFNMPADTTVLNTLKKLVIGNPSVKVSSSVEINTESWQNCLANLEYLDVTNYAGIKLLYYDSMPNLRTLLASGTSLNSFAPAEGSNIDSAVLPNGYIRTLTLNKIKFTNGLANSLTYTPDSSLMNVSLNLQGISGEENVNYYLKIVSPWFKSINAKANSELIYSQCNLTANNIEWPLSTMAEVRNFGKLPKGGLSLTGVLNLQSISAFTQSDINEIKSIFGEHCFDESMSSLYVKTPTSIFITNEENSIVAGQSLDIHAEEYPDSSVIEKSFPEINYYIVNEVDSSTAEDDTIITDKSTLKKYQIIEDLSKVRSGITLTTISGNSINAYGKLTTEEFEVGGNTQIKILAKLKIQTEGGMYSVSVKDLTIKEPTYASRIVINGDNSLYKGNDYTFSVTPYTVSGSTPIGTHEIEWSVSGATEGEDISKYISSTEVVNGNFIIHMDESNEPEISSSIVVKAKWTNNNESKTTVESESSVLILNQNVIMTDKSNPVVMKAIYDAGLCEQETAIKKSEAEAITNDQFGTILSNISSSFSFNEFKYFTGITELKDSAFTNSEITSIILPNTITSIGNYCFANCSSLKSILARIGTEDAVSLPTGITKVNEGCFLNCSSLNELEIPDGVTTIDAFAFGGTSFKYVYQSGYHDLVDGSIIIPETITDIDGNAFETHAWDANTTDNPLEVFTLPKNINISTDTYKIFYGKNYTEFIVIPHDETQSNLGNGGTYTDDGILYGNGILLRYPPKKAYKESYTMLGVQYINNYAFFAVSTLDEFRSCSVLASTGIFDNAFYMSDIKRIILNQSASLTTIPNYAFYNCTKLETVLLPVALTTLGVSSFNGCSSLASIDLPDNLTTLASANFSSHTFSNCSSLEKLILPDNVETIGNDVVYNCQNLVEFDFPKYYKGIAIEMANERGTKTYISNCFSLEKIVLPVFSYTDEDNTYYTVLGEDGNGYKYVHHVSFNDETEAELYKSQSGGTEIISGHTNYINLGIGQAIVESTNVFNEYALNESDDNQLMECIDGCLYRNFKYNGRKELLRVPSDKKDVSVNDGTKLINGIAFLNCHNVTISMTDSVDELGGDGMFMYNSNLRSIRLSKNITILPTRSFLEDSGLVTINLEDSLTSIGEECFNGCTSISALTIPENISTVNKSTFRNMKSLSSIVFKGEIDNILDFAFNSDTKLSTMVFAKNITPASINVDKNVSWPTTNVHRYNAFGYMNVTDFVGYDVASEGNNKLLLPYGYNGYEENEEWKNPLLTGTETFTNASGETLTVTKCCFSAETLTIGVDSLNITLADTITAPDTIYAKSESGKYVYQNGTASSTKGTDGVYVFESANKIYAEEKVTLYSDTGCTTSIGEFTAEYGIKDYAVGETTMSYSNQNSTISLFSTGLFGASNDESTAEESNDEEMAQITKSEYETLVARLNQLTEKLNNLSK